MAKIQAWKVSVTREDLGDSLEVVTSIIESYHQQRVNAATSAKAALDEILSFGYYTMYSEGVLGVGNYTTHLAHTVIAPKGAGYIVAELACSVSIESIIIAE